jgi:hypothetical protein
MDDPLLDELKWCALSTDMEMSGDEHQVNIGEMCGRTVARIETLTARAEALEIAGQSFTQKWLKELDRVKALEKALIAAPLRARNEDSAAFDRRQTAWLRDHVRPLMRDDER